MICTKIECIDKMNELYRCDRIVKNKSAMSHPFGETEFVVNGRPDREIHPDCEIERESS